MKKGKGIIDQIQEASAPAGSSQSMDDLRNAVFDTTSYPDQVINIIVPTDIGPVMFGTDGRMRYGDNFEEEVPDNMKALASEGLKRFNKKDQ